PAAMEKLILDEDIKLNGFMCPGHVATIIGINKFNNLAERYMMPMAICGFQAVDILGGILTIIDAIEQREYICVNRYSRVVREYGNLAALKVLKEVFEPSSASWRGLEIIEDSGLKLRKEYEEFDAELKYSLKTVDEKAISGCICGEILKGKKLPHQCSLYKVKCTPQRPIGPCMVSTEGTCGIAYAFEE
ncbi:MAG: hydrogenase formation protein HypD, partial [Clostridium sp.]